MVPENIRFALNKLQWQLWVTLFQAIAHYSPVDGYEVETSVIAEFYNQRLHSFTYFRSNKNGVMYWTIPYSVAFSADLFFGDTSNQYNVLLRVLIQPYLPKGKPIVANDEKMISK